MKRIYCLIGAVFVATFASNAAGQPAIGPQPLPAATQLAPTVAPKAAPAAAPAATATAVSAPATGCSTCANTESSGKRPGIVQRFFDRPFFTNHSCAPDGCPTPVGPGNAWTEFKFVFGSARQYFGDADSSRGHFYKTTVPPPYRIPYPQNQ